MLALALRRPSTLAPVACSALRRAAYSNKHTTPAPAGEARVMFSLERAGFVRAASAGALLAGASWLFIGDTAFRFMTLDGVLAPLWLRAAVGGAFASLGLAACAAGPLLAARYVRRLALVGSAHVRIEAYSAWGGTRQRVVPLGAVELSPPAMAVLHAAAGVPSTRGAQHAFTDDSAAAPRAAGRRSYAPLRVAGDRTHYLVDMERGLVHDAAALRRLAHVAR